MRRQVQFYEVPEEDLEQLRKEFAAGQLALDISEQSFSLKCASSLCSVSAVTCLLPQRPCSAAHHLQQCILLWPTLRTAHHSSSAMLTFTGAAGSTTPCWRQCSQR